jgi:hypothetical protein
MPLSSSSTVQVRLPPAFFIRQIPQMAHGTLDDKKHIYSRDFMLRFRDVRWRLPRVLVHHRIDLTRFLQAQHDPAMAQQVLHAVQTKMGDPKSMVRACTPSLPSFSEV